MYTYISATSALGEDNSLQESMDASQSILDS